MMRHYFIVYILLFPLVALAQDISKLTNLDDTVAETSGLIYFEERLITHNDSGGMNALYEIDKSDGSILRTVSITNADNVDWEDICQDDNYIYIGDFGNNNGSRSDLKIYKILKSDYLSSQEVSAEIIEFSYEDQVDFTPSPNNTNYDAEALISFGSKLFVFTKNWVDLRTNIYEVPKEKGTYQVKKIDEFDAEGLITGGVYNPLSQKVILTGYGGIRAFSIELRGFTDGLFSNGVIDKYTLAIPLTSSFQVEAIAYENATVHAISAEKNALGDAALYALTSNTLDVEDLELLQHQIYPNPAGESLSISSTMNFERLEIYDDLGRMVYEDVNASKQVDISSLEKGIYIIKLYTFNRSKSFKFLKQ